MRIIVFGASGMLGHVLYSELAKSHEVLGVCRSHKWHDSLIDGVDISNLNQVETVVQNFKPDMILNAVGIIKQIDLSKDRIQSIKINALWPHQLAEIAKKYSSRVVHFSTDCVFSGARGGYLEDDLADARDTYGLSKYMGEIDFEHCLTLRTSIIGHELNSHRSLIDWFLSQKGEVKGFNQAIYSGLPTIEIANFLNTYVFSNWVSGVYHLSADKISKYELLNLVKERYKKEIKINKDDEFKMYRDLNSEKLQKIYGFKIAPWSELVKKMHFHFENSGLYKGK